MSSNKVFIYAEFQVSVPFDQIDWEPINVNMKKFAGLKSKTWLSGIGSNSVGGFYEFDSEENAQNYIDNLLVPVTKNLQGNLSVKLFNGDIVKDASIDMSSPFYSKES
jgi:uncharacterized linocin/CFP29 family protein